MAFKKWQNIPELQEAVSKLENSSRKYSSLIAENSTDSKAQARKLWAAMSSSYWDILLALVDAKTQTMPEKLAFDAEERLFIDLGCLPGITDLAANFDSQAFLQAKCQGGILPAMTFSDYIAESWAAITGNDSPVPAIGMSLDSRIDYLTNISTARSATKNYHLSPHHLPQSSTPASSPPQ